MPFDGAVFISDPSRPHLFDRHVTVSDFNFRVAASVARWSMEDVGRIEVCEVVGV